MSLVSSRQKCEARGETHCPKHKNTESQDNRVPCINVHGIKGTFLQHSNCIHCVSFFESYLFLHYIYTYLNTYDEVLKIVGDPNTNMLLQRDFWIGPQGLTYLKISIFIKVLQEILEGPNTENLCHPDTTFLEKSRLEE